VSPLTLWLDRRVSLASILRALVSSKEMDWNGCVVYVGSSTWVDFVDEVPLWDATPPHFNLDQEDKETEFLPLVMRSILRQSPIEEKHKQCH